MIGVHLMVDGVLRERPDGTEISEILSELPAEIEMSILAGPIVVKGKPENPGWTGFVIIDKSHIAVHTFDDGNRIAVDVFSCRPFEKEAVLDYLQRHIKLRKYNVQMLTRSEE